MSFGLSRGRELDPTGVEVPASSLPPLPDDLLKRPESGFIDPRTWFPDAGRPFDIEIGSGKGSFLLNQAAAEPGANYLGIEWEREFFVYAADRVRRRGLANVRMLHADATSFIRWRVPSAIVRTIHLYFSDPWPKTKHHKNRVIQHAFLAQAWRVLVPGGELRVVTDHAELWAWDRAHFAPWTEPGHPEAASAIPDWLRNRLPGEALRLFHVEPFEPPTWAGEGELVGTNYERKMVPEGERAHACVLRKAT